MAQPASETAPSVFMITSLLLLPDSLYRLNEQAACSINADIQYAMNAVAAVYAVKS